MNFKTSVVVPTYNGGLKLPNLLHGLLNQTRTDFELVIVIDGSTDETESVLAKFANQFSSLKVIRQLNAGRAVTRNNGVEMATGDVIIFFDDDVTPGATCIEQHVKFHEKNDGLLTGIPREEVNKLNNDIQNYKACLSSGWLSKYNDGLNKLDKENLFFSTANCSIRKTTFLKLGMFNLSLSDGEDYELAYRALKNGIGVYLDKTNVVLHDDRITISSYINRLRQYKIAHNDIKAIHAEIDLSNYKPNLLKKIVYSFFASRFWVVLLERHNLLKFVPVRLRYKLYSVVIQSLSVVHPHVSIK
jgi:glycosyltransferase involved in cell wall biosynthesis